MDIVAARGAIWSTLETQRPGFVGFLMHFETDIGGDALMGVESLTDTGEVGICTEKECSLAMQQLSGAIRTSCSVPGRGI